jgi:hypothetical protein
MIIERRMNYLKLITKNKCVLFVVQTITMPLVANPDIPSKKEK